MKLKYLFILVWMLISTSMFSQVKQDFAYKSVNGTDIDATIYLPELDEELPVLIYFHGGGFIFGNRTQGLENILKEKLLENKIAVISADYRLAPETSMEEIIKDAADIVSWVKTNGKEKFNINPNKIAVAGGSAGGYLALTTGFDPEYAPSAIITISAPTGFSTAGIQTGDTTLLKDIKKASVISHGDYDTRMDLWRYMGKNGVALYGIFGFDPAKEPHKLEAYTLTNNIKTDYPPTMVIHAKNDRSVKLDEAQSLYNLLQDKKIESELCIVENGHSSELIKQHPEVINKTIDFLNKLWNRK